MRGDISPLAAGALMAVVICVFMACSTLILLSIFDILLALIKCI